jgi:hypothetical protein
VLKYSGVECRALEGWSSLLIKNSLTPLPTPPLPHAYNHNWLIQQRIAWPLMHVIGLCWPTSSYVTRYGCDQLHGCTDAVSAMLYSASHSPQPFKALLHICVLSTDTYASSDTQLGQQIRPRAFAVTLRGRHIQACRSLNKGKTKKPALWSAVMNHCCIAAHPTCLMACCGELSGTGAYLTSRC